MNIGNNVKPKFICEKCGEPIKYIARKGLSYRHNYGIFKDYAYHKAFDLCPRCNKELKRWLKEKPIPRKLSVKDIINKFQEYKEIER